MNTIDIIKERYRQLQSNNGSSALTPLEQQAYNTFTELGIPTVKNEEWKYTRISGAFNKEYAFNPESYTTTIYASDIDAYRLPGYEEANELVFVNGLYSSSLSTLRSSALTVLSLDEATKGEHRELVMQHLGQSSKYIKDGLNALNTAFAAEGVFIHV
ncbi:MAG TPA: Fe-S cluster assembly protein SufD, partial [Flavisolibacter sp.]|nr:Fe-S cluster assembly protein SufD [Flavisolibacter sp.]